MAQAQGIGARQIKAARALLDWSQEDLAIFANLSIATIRKIEMGFISPRHSTTFVIRQAIERAGIEFLENDGIRRRNEDVAVFEGSDRLSAFFDDIQKTVALAGGEIMTVGACLSHHGELDEIADCHERVSIRCLITETTASRAITAASNSALEFRSLSKHYVDPTPFYVYGDKHAVLTGDGSGTASKIVVIRSLMTAETSRRHFLSMWDKATPLHLSVKRPSTVVEATY